MGFVGNYAPGGLSPQMYDMPVIRKIEAGQKVLASLIFKAFVRMPGCRSSGEGPEEGNYLSFLQP